MIVIYGIYRFWTGFNKKNKKNEEAMSVKVSVNTARITESSEDQVIQ